MPEFGKKADQQPLSCEERSLLSEKPVTVTLPDLPALENLVPYLQRIWDNRILTNGGPMHEEFETALRDHLGVKHISLFNNGTIALLTALRALRITGEVITTPYSFVATAHALLWNDINPVFSDIDPDTLNLAPSKIEASITPQTTAIMPVHCYGNPCNVSEIQKIADNYNLKVIYDAAHAFGVADEGGSILRHGDLSVLSFHATKVFNTFEGGAIVSPDLKTKERIDRLKNFGFVDEVTVAAVGINGKMSEINASIGLLQLTKIGQSIAHRRLISEIYRSRLQQVKGIELLKPQPNIYQNHSYFPILVKPEFPVTRDALYELLKSRNIFGRRYFYPLISNFPIYRNIPTARPSNLPVANAISQQVICLPIHASLDPAMADKIAAFIEGIS